MNADLLPSSQQKLHCPEKGRSSILISRFTGALLGTPEPF